MLEEDVEVALDLGRLEVPRRAARHPEALVEQRAIHPLDEAVGPRRVHARRAVLDAFHAEQELVRMRLGSTTELPAVVEYEGMQTKEATPSPWSGYPFS